MKAWTIVAYQLNAAEYCPNCVGMAAILRMESAWNDCPDLADHFGAFDNSGNLTGSAERFLDGLAESVGIDREDEWSFDSGDFPKVVFASQMEPYDDGTPRICDRCHDELS